MPTWFWVLGLLLTVVIVAGNGLVIYLITGRKRLHTKANWFILSLAMADFCVGFSSAPPMFACEFWFSCEAPVIVALRWLFLYASVSNLCVMTVDRYIAITSPLRYIAVVTHKRVVLLISAAWLVPLAVGLLPLAWLHSASAESAGHIYVLVVLIVFEVTPTLVLTIAAIRLFLVARQHAKRIAILVTQLRYNHSSTGVRVSSLHHRPASLRVLNVVVVFYVLCYGGEVVLSTCYVLEMCEPRALAAYPLVKLLLIANSAVNPLAYAFLKTDIKREIKKFFECGFVSRFHPSVFSHGGDGQPSNSIGFGLRMIRRGVRREANS